MKGRRGASETGGAFGMSVVVHAVVLMLLTIAVPRGPAPLSELVDVAFLTELPEIDGLTEDRLAGPPKPRAERGVATRSPARSNAPARTSEPEPTPKPPAERAPRPTPPPAVPAPATEVRDAAADLAAAAPPAPEAPPVATPRLESRESARSALVPDQSSRAAGTLTDARAGAADVRAPAPALPARSQATLASRARDVDVDAVSPATRVGGGDVADAVGSAAVPAGGALTSTTRAAVPGGAALESRARTGGLADAAGAPSTGSEGVGRRTILDYGDGAPGGDGGALTGRARKRSPVETVSAPVAPDADEDVADAASALGGDGVSMSLSGPISGRAIVSAVPPIYPDDSRRHGHEGAVAVHFTVLADGTVKDNMYVDQASAHHALDQAAMASLRQWRFSPLPAADAQVEQWGVLTIIFRLQ